MNPYYKAWLAITCGGELYEYIIWITGKHNEYKKLDPISTGYHERFALWLEAQCFTLETV
jgi:hypothetical protein